MQCEGIQDSAVLREKDGEERRGYEVVLGSNFTKFAVFNIADKTKDMLTNY